MSTLNQVKRILIDTLSLSSGEHELGADTALLGSVAELDSMAVVHVIGALEEYFGIAIEDDEISGKTFESVGSLSAFVDSKLAQ